MVIKLQKYASDKYYHLREADPDKKDTSYYRRNCESIYSTYLRGRTGVTYQEAYDFTTLRMFGDGKQYESRYKNYFLREELPTPADAVNASGTHVGTSMENRRKGYFNVLWDVVSPATKILSTLIGNFLSFEYDIVADAVDKYSKNSVQDEKVGLWVEKENMEYFKALYQQIGLDYKPPEFVPETVEELELYEMNGGFKPAYARIIEQLVDHTLDISDWRDEIKKSLYRDLIDLGVISTRDYYCDVDNKIKTKYILTLQY